MDTKAIDIIKQISYKVRAMDVINSCISADHFAGAKRYVENYYNITEDYLGFQELNAHLNEKRINSLYPQY